MMLRYLPLLCALACGGAIPQRLPVDSPADTGARDSTPAPDSTPPPTGCPAEMARIDAYCVDRWEAHLADQSPFAVPTQGVAASAPGVTPQGYLSGTVAAAACAAAGKRLCTEAEWSRACRGPDARIFPYDGSYDPTACNVQRAAHPIVELFGADATWSSAQMNDPRLNQLPNSLATTGYFSRCVTPEGVYDLHGNLHEWIDDASGVFRGGFYVDARINGEGCTYRTSAHSFSYHDYSTGFRCCKNAE